MAVNHDVAGDDQTRPAIRPTPIEPDQRVPRCVILIGKVFLHGSLGDSVWDHRAIG
ncbi:hypothetical protein D3C78_683670 [compost metagenome]